MPPKTGINTHAIVAAREAYAARFASLTEAIEFETYVLGIGREFLPECALAVLDDSNAATVEYYEWLLEQANEAHDAADESEDTQAEDARLLAEIERTYAAAAGPWTGRQWDDGDKITPESTDDQIASMLTREESLQVTCWGIHESDDRHTRCVRQAVTDLVVAWNSNDMDKFSSYCDALRSLAETSDAGVATQAAIAETSAAEAIKAARAGEKLGREGARRVIMGEASEPAGDIT